MVEETKFEPKVETFLGRPREGPYLVVEKWKKLPHQVANGLYAILLRARTESGRTSECGRRELLSGAGI
ncbi:MAG: hypothetical protein HYY22_09420 [Thaumarchaeota archaeon]|nr:hypothetical protein [Nitrososphaerota archaeon]